MVSPESRAQALSLDKSQLIYLPPRQREQSHADGFDLLGDFIGSLQAGQRSGLVLLPLPVDATVQWLDSVRALIDAPLLFAVNSDSVAAQQGIEREFSGERNFDFVLHPFDLDEVRSKAQGLLHRTTLAAYGAGRNELLIYRGYRFQISERRVFHEEREMYLQPRIVQEQGLPLEPGAALWPFLAGHRQPALSRIGCLRFQDSQEAQYRTGQWIDAARRIRPGLQIAHGFANVPQMN